MDEEDAANERKKKAGQQYDPLLKVKPLLDDLQLSCSSYYVQGQKLSIDERMVAWKGRFCTKQFTKDKPVRWGFKFWVLASSVVSVLVSHVFGFSAENVNSSLSRTSIALLLVSFASFCCGDSVCEVCFVVFGLIFIF